MEGRFIFILFLAKLVMTSITVVSAMHANATGSNQKWQLKTASLNVLKAF
jgi:hypothetical protein